jgi:hypothetical protein
VLQIAPQLMPEGELVTVPAPVSLTLSVKTRTKVADTAAALFIVTLQPALPLHAPPQPLSTHPAAGVALKTTFWPVLKLLLHVAPQLIPLGVLVTVPLPVMLTESEKLCCAKVATTLCTALMFSTQLPVPLQAPLQPVNSHPTLGAALSVTCWPATKLALQVAPQLMPLGMLVTVPDPLSVTVSRCFQPLTRWQR